MTINYLDINQRPDYLVATIDYAQQQLATQSKSQWNLFNGSTQYSVFHVKEHALMKELILAALPKRKIFYALDGGAGNFQWLYGLAGYIDTQVDLPEDITVHIIGMRGESYYGPEIEKTHRCVLHFLGNFKIEKLFEAASKLKPVHSDLLDLRNKIDLFVSHWCLRHLADGVGTLKQLIESLVPETGYGIFDGFIFLYQKQDPEKTSFNHNMALLMRDMKIPFLTRFFDGTRSLNHFIVRRPDAEPCRLPMKYLNYVWMGEMWHIGSHCATQFHREDQKIADFRVPMDAEKSHLVYGDIHMHNWLRQKKLYTPSYSHSLWEPIEEKDHIYLFMQLPLQAALTDGDLAEIEACLKQYPQDINLPDHNGYPPLHYTIKEKQYAHFLLLLDHHPDLTAETSQKLPPLHLAAQIDKQGRFIHALLKKQPDINAQATNGLSSLDVAIKARNTTAIEILITAGAKISDRNITVLKESSFHFMYSIQKIVKENEESRLSGYARVCKWIREGEFVVLHYDGSHGIRYYYPVEFHVPKLIVVNINPHSGILHEGEWPGFLQSQQGYVSAPYDPNEVSRTLFSGTFPYRFAW